MIRLIPVLFALFYISCSTQQNNTKTESVSASSSAGMEKEIQISAKLISIENTLNKFKVLAIIQNETDITSFSKGDTIYLYPNFIRKEGEELNTKSSENEQMISLQNLQPGSRFNATIKIRGMGKKSHGLIMDWTK